MKLPCEEAKIKQHTFSKKELCEIGEEAIWESRFTCFCFLTEEALFSWKKNFRAIRVKVLRIVQNAEIFDF